MTRFIVRSVLALAACTLAAAPALAYPSIRTSQPGSAIIIYAANSEDRAYNCTITYDWAYDSFGETKTGHEEFQVGIGAKTGDTQIHRFQGSYVNLRITGGPSMNCNPA
ncbi:MAG: hypothetical protein ACKOOL_08295 [Novosphingobium sp.]